jgi:hypothetical protein
MSGGRFPGYSGRKFGSTTTLEEEGIVIFRLGRVAVAIALLIAGSGTFSDLQAQGLTGQISGVITDSGGGVIPGATVTIKNVGTNSTRDTVTGADGAFVFPDLLAGTYDLTAKLEGFKTYEQKGIVLGSTDRVALRAIALEVGGVAELVTVKSEATLVQTSTAARSGLITRDNIEDIALKGRDFAGMLKLLPGVIDTSNREAPGWGSMGGLSINGRGGGFNFSYDGVTNKDTGSNSGNYAAPALDSIAEVRVQTSNFQAEYGRSSGATITVVTRSGSKDFHGSAAYYKRDDALNGNEYQRRVNCQAGQTSQCKAPDYKFDNEAWTLGGPVLIPGTSFNSGRNKLFFFWSQDIIQRTDPGNVNQRRMPTALERIGDFSQTVDTQGRPLFIRDPNLTGNCALLTGGPACFPGSVIPANRLDPVGRQLLSLLPMPTTAQDANGQNYAFQTIQDWPRNDQVARIDWNIAPNTTAYGRLQFGYEKRAGGVSFLGSGGGWPQQPSKYEIDTVSYVNTLLHTFNQSLFSELTVGVNWAHQYTSAFDAAARDANDSTIHLPGWRQFFPEANPDHLLPNASFNGGASGTIASFNSDNRWPFFGFNTLFNVSGNITKIAGAHNIKTGLFVEHTTRPAQRASTYNGTLSFNTDNSNPGNTNIGFANALLGNITEYTESNGHPSAHGQFMNTEFYVQDNWRIKRNFTIDGGVRFYYITPTQSEGDKVAGFDPSAWQANAAPQLFQPINAPGLGRRAVNPSTGDVFPLVYLGRLVPNTGNFTNGMQVYDGTPQQKNPFKLAPRIGFAWDLTGDGKTAVRGGFGTFYDRYSDDNVLDLIELPPLLSTYRTNYTTIPELLASPLTATPTNVRLLQEFVPPVVHNWSLGVQRDIGFNLVGDLAYVGNAARNSLVTQQINGRPYGYQYLSSSLDQTNVVGGIVQPLPDDLLRPYRGYGSIGQRQFTGESDYHSLQLTINRRRSGDGLNFGGAYTYQISNKSIGAPDPFLTPAEDRARNYNSSGRRPHTLVINYSYEPPNLGAKWNNILVKALLDNWQFSGITSILSGTQGGFGYSFANLPTGTLSGTGAINGGGTRANLLCDPFLPRSERTFERQFKTECIGPATDQFRLGTSQGDEFMGPGFINWDISAFKHIPMGGARRLQIRVELYNAFNTDQWTGTNTTGNFDWATRALTNAATFGRLNGNTQSARRIQLGARFTF